MAQNSHFRLLEGRAKPDIQLDATLIPSSGQKDALAGSYGTPGSSNKFVTQTDPSLMAMNPRQKTCWHDESTVVVGQELDPDPDTLSMYYVVCSQNPPANNDKFSQEIELDGGTYSFFALGSTQSDCGIVDWYLDSNTFETGQDWYSSSTVKNVIKSKTGITVSGGRHTIYGLVNGKNASSSGYRCVLAKFWFKRTGT